MSLIRHTKAMPGYKIPWECLSPYLDAVNLVYATVFCKVVFSVDAHVLKHSLPVGKEGL